MRLKGLFFISFFVICSMSLIPAMAQNESFEDWDLTVEEEDLIVYTRSNPESAINEFMIVMQVSSTIERISTALLNAEGYKDWVFKCVESKRIKSLTKMEFFYYILTDFPFPFDDRELVVHNWQWFDQESGAYHSRSRSDNTLIEESGDNVRIKYFSCAWDIVPISQARYEIRYTASASPGGVIPDWVVNLALLKGPLETMYAFRKVVTAQDQ